MQVELARLTCMRPMRPCTGPMKLHLMCMACQDATELRRRERELFRTHCDRWFPVPNGYGLDWGITLSDSDAATDLRSHYVVHRGFVKVVVCPISTWCGGQCVWCDDWPGRGGSVGSAQPPWCPMCDSNTGRTPGIGRQVVAACPGLVEVRATDREPWHNSGAGVWVWLVSIDQVDPAASDRCRIPPALWPHLQPQEGRLTSAHPTRAAALAALSAALVELGRTRAGLSPA